MEKKEKKRVVSMAMRPSVKSKLQELSEVNGYSMSGYLEVLLLEQWRDYQKSLVPASTATILSNGKSYVPN